MLHATLPALFSVTLSPALSVSQCANACAAGCAGGQTACHVRPTLRQSWSCHSHGSPLRPVPVSAPPTGLDECLFFISLVSDFLAVGFSVSSGCARRRSVSAYAAILVLPRCDFYFIFVTFLYFPFMVNIYKLKKLFLKMKSVGNLIKIR